MGVDSLGFLVRYLGLDGRPRLRLAWGEIDAIFFEDTGVEMPYTIQYADWLEGKCSELGIPFIIVGMNDSVVAPSKRGPMDAAYLRQPKPGIPTRTPRSCTISRKVQPCSNLLNAHHDLRRGRWRQGDLIAGVDPGTRHRVVLGIATDEAHRCDGQTRAVDPHRAWIEVHYPMVEFEMTRAGAAEAIRRAGWPRALKSGCFCCPCQPLGHYWAISRIWPDLYERALAMEMAAWAHNPKLTLTGKPLEEAVAGWEKRHWPLPDPWDILADGYAQDRSWG
jgi:hypothetical protein